MRGWSLIILGVVCLARDGAASDESEGPEVRSRQLMVEGAKQVVAGKDLIRSSTRYIQLGSRLTRHANRLRYLARKAGSAQSELQSIASEITTQAGELKDRGAELRRLGDGLKIRGTETMRHGFLGLRGLHPREVRPISLKRGSASNPDGARIAAHNSPFRSLKSSQQEAQDVRSSKTLEIGNVNPTQTIPEGLDASPLQVSVNSRYFAYVTSAVGDIDLNRIHDWHLVLTDRRGDPVESAKIVVEGTMPGHVHGMPTKPRVVEELAAGRYVVGGMKFQMAGWWVITFVVDAESQNEDRIIYNILL